MSPPQTDPPRGDVLAAASDEFAYAGADGTRLFSRRWRSQTAPVRARLLVVHGYQEHGGRYRELGVYLAGLGIETVATDLRGHGRSEGPRGHVDNFAAYETDLVRMASGELAKKVPTFVLGHSLGGLIVLSAAAQGQLTGVAGVLVTNPYLDLAMPVPRLKLWLGLALARVMPNFGLGNGIDPRWLTHDPGVLAGYREDPLLLNRATAGWFVAARGAQRDLRRQPSLPLPLLFAYSDGDPIASPTANAAYAARVRCADKAVLLRRGELHELLQEVHRRQLMEAMAAWMLQRLPGAA